MRNLVFAVIGIVVFSISASVFTPNSIVGAQAAELPVETSYGRGHHHHRFYRHFRHHHRGCHAPDFSATGCGYCPCCPSYCYTWDDDASPLDNILALGIGGSFLDGGLY